MTKARRGRANDETLYGKSFGTKVTLTWFPCAEPDIKIVLVVLQYCYSRNIWNSSFIAYTLTNIGSNVNIEYIQLNFIFCPLYCLF